MSSIVCLLCSLLCLYVYVYMYSCVLIEYCNLSMSSPCMRHKYIFLIHMNLHTCPHTLSLTVMQAHVHRRQQQPGFEHLLRAT